jgi:hypothetical protein
MHKGEKRWRPPKERAKHTAVRWSCTKRYKRILASGHLMDTNAERMISSPPQRGKGGLFWDNKKAQWSGRHGQDQIDRVTIDRGANGIARVALDDRPLRRDTVTLDVRPGKHHTPLPRTHRQTGRNCGGVAPEPSRCHTWAAGQIIRTRGERGGSFVTRLAHKEDQRRYGAGLVFP